MQETYITICNLVTGFSNYSDYLLKNPILESYIKALIEVINNIKINTEKITLVEIGKDLRSDICYEG